MHVKIHSSLVNGLHRAALCLVALVAMMVAPVTWAATAKPAASQAASPSVPIKFRPGLWRIESVSTQESTQTTSKVSSQVCLTAADSQNLIRLVPPQMQANMSCESGQAQVQGQVISWRVKCSGPKQTMTGTGSITLARESYEGRVTLELAAGGKPVAIEQKVSARRVQDCQ